MSVLVLAVLGGSAWYFMTDEDRARLVRFVRRGTGDFGTFLHATSFARDPLTDALRDRTPWLLVVPAFAAINVAVFLRMWLWPSDLNQLQLIVYWGGNFAPRTGNGEWWRLITATFVHPTTLSFIVNTVALLSAGRILERLVGPITFATVYLAAGVMGALTSLWISAVGVTAGASAAVFGMYGLLLACWMWGAFRKSITTVRLASIRKLAVPAALFVAYSLWSAELGTPADIAGVTTGFLAGLLLARHAAERKPSLVRVAAAAVSSVLIVFLLSEPVRGVVDPRGEIAAVMELEKRTASSYEAAASRFRRGTARAPELASLIEKTIVPDLHSMTRRINGLGRVPVEHQEAIVAARTYLRLREDAWRLRARALQKASMPMLREADAGEQRALRAYDDFNVAAVEAARR